MVLLDPDAFLTELGKLFTKHRNTGAVVITLKKYNGHTKPTPKPRKGKPGKKEGEKEHVHPQPDEHLCLIRAKAGNKKLSTHVSSKKVTKFQINMAALMRSNCTAMKRKEKLKKEKKKVPPKPKKKD
ncbi:Signal recognition particle 14 kDa protein [Oopsacas minuta]|uniref:Signal recognition particle 14 kDa protein n=1 Tax=Oopsacas minuta TaxID=111878 RepID=A0AAV7K7D0_9METZ|nr:Signal recognition particle 14 kDa protein [Oopsacas minuta]